MAKRDLRDSTITIRDGTTLSVEVFLGTGNLTWTENTPMEYEPERGSVANGSVRRADEQPVEVSVTGKWERVTSVSGEGELITPYELLKQMGNASAAETTGADDCEPYACEIEISFLPPCGSELAERVVFSEFRVEQCTFDPQAGTLVFSGKSREVTPTYDRPTPPDNTVAPSVNGTPVQGQTLARIAGVWDSGTQSAIQWYRADNGSGLNEAAIAAATANSYVLVAGDVGKYVSFKLTYTSDYGSTTEQSNRVSVS